MKNHSTFKNMVIFGREALGFYRPHAILRVSPTYSATKYQPFLKTERTDQFFCLNVYLYIYMYITKQSIARTKCIMSRPTYNVEMKKKSRRDTTSTAETGTRYLYRKHISCLLIWYLRFNKRNMDTIGRPWILVTTTSKSVYFTYLQDINNPIPIYCVKFKRQVLKLKG